MTISFRAVRNYIYKATGLRDLTMPKLKTNTVRLSVSQLLDLGNAHQQFGPLTLSQWSTLAQRHYEMIKQKQPSIGAEFPTLENFIRACFTCPAKEIRYEGYGQTFISGLSNRFFKEHPGPLDNGSIDFLCTFFTLKRGSINLSDRIANGQGYDDLLVELNAEMKRMLALTNSRVIVRDE